MQILFKCFGPVRRVCESSEILIDVNAGATVHDVIMHVIDKFGPPLRDLLMNGSHVSGNFIIMLNKHDVNTLGGMNIIVHDGDEVSILPHVQGGR
ncbi:MAG: MoaD/ThiS family protein [Candidatus Thorarchaeota archaeon]|nr:MoaD/ThiS family protein [Candidatus Thorarchaeota archaeon]